MSKLGKLFKSEREKRDLSFHEIGMSLKINPKILKAIEDGDLPNLPAKTFLRGFVKSYAQYFRLNVEGVMQQFQDEYGTTRPEAPIPIVSNSPSNSASTPSIKTTKSLKKAADSALPASTTNKLFPIVGAIVLLILIAFVAKMMDKYQRESQVSKIAVTGSEVSPTTSTTLLPEPSTSTTNEQLQSPINGNTESQTSTSTTLSTAVSSVVTGLPTSTTTTTAALKAVAPTPSTTTTLKVIAPVSTTTTTSTTTTLRAVAPTTTTSTTTTTLTVGATKAQTTEIIIEALNKVSVRFSLNGGKWETLELNPDQVHTLRSKTKIQVEVSDGGAVNVIVNGRDRGVAGIIGKPIKLTYP